MEGKKLPRPLLVQAGVLDGLLMVPARLITPPLEQTIGLGPAVTVAILMMDISTVSCTAAQAPLLVDVKVKMTVPEVISAALIA